MNGEQVSNIVMVIMAICGCVLMMGGTALLIIEGAIHIQELLQ